MVFKRIIQKRKSIKNAWILSYIAVLLVPILIGVIIQFRMEKVIETEINRANGFYLKQIKFYMDSLAGDAKKLSTEIAFSPRIQSVLNFNKELSNQNRYELYKCSNELKGLNIARSTESELYIYLKKSDIILSSTGGYDSKEFYNSYSDIKKQMTYEQWMETLNQPHRGDYVAITDTKKDVSDNNNRSIMYIRSLPLLEQKDMLANIVFYIDKSKFEVMSKEVGAINEGRVLIINKDNTIITDTGNYVLSDDIKYEKLTGESGLLYSLENDENVVISYIGSQEEKWKYVYIMPTRVFWEKLKYARKLTHISIALCVVLGSMLMMVLTKRNYAPVQKLIGSLSKNSGLLLDLETNEYNLIQKAIGKTINDKQEINRKLTVQNNLLKSRFVERLLLGKTTQSIVEDASKSFDVKFESSYFAVIIFYIKDFSGFMPDVGSEDNDYYKSIRLFQFIMTNILEEIAGRNNFGYVTEINEDIVCLINFKENNVAGSKEELVALTKEVLNFIAEKFGVKLTAAISSIHETVIGISQAYDEALETLEYKLVTSDDEITFYNADTDDSKGVFYYPADKEQQLINYIKARDFERAKNLFDEIFEMNFKERTLNSQAVKHLIFNMVGTIYKVINEVSVLNDSEIKEKLDGLEKLIYSKKISMVKEEMLNVVQTLCNYKYIENSSSNLQVVRIVTEYVGRCYADENLSISSIAEQLDLHPAYVSRLFKEQAGMGIQEYINNIRIEKAKQIMNNRDLKLEEISKVVGYSNIRTFSRAFIKHQGMTPGKYRDMV